MTYFCVDGDALDDSVSQEDRVGFVEGECVRDWQIDDPPLAIFPYDRTLMVSATSPPQSLDVLWPFRTSAGIRLKRSEKRSS